jgi:hypothetical protein
VILLHCIQEQCLWTIVREHSWTVIDEHVFDVMQKVYESVI